MASYIWDIWDYTENLQIKQNVGKIKYDLKWFIFFFHHM